MEATYVRLFEKQAAYTPNAVAVTFADTSLTYSQLNKKADNLAAALQSNGTDNFIVGICENRSVETIISVLAILKAGHAYLPLDPNFPNERLQQIIESSGVKRCLAPSSQKQRLESLPLKLIISDEAFPDAQPVDIDQPIAYVLYTSGSTGTPKGVAMGHKAITNLLKWQNNNSLTATGTRTLQFTNLGFDVSFQEIFSTLTTGGTLVLVDNKTKTDPSGLLNYIKKNSVNRIFLPFVALQYLMEAADVEQLYPQCLKEITTAGEQLKVTTQMRRFFQECPTCTLYNHYGPTETHIVTQFKLTGAPSQWPALPPIGVPVDNVEMYILDNELKEVPNGEIGELCASGIALAEGYLNRPDLTAEKFIYWDKTDTQKIRIYKTGDLARRHADGNIEFLGRIDHQVKINGYRVELGEIETILLKDPMLKDCVVVQQQVDGTGELVAYYTIRPSQKLKEDLASRLVTALRAQLPDYMVPKFFVKLPALPLNSNGKVDRKLLPQPTERYHAKQSDFVAPATDTEREIATIWKKNLRIKEIGVDDNFFDLGGHSLMVTKVISQVNKKFETKISFSTLYNLPTIRQLAHSIENNLDESFSPVMLIREGVGSPLFLFAGVFGSPLTFSGFSEYYSPQQPLYSVSNPTDREDFEFTSAQSYASYIINHIKAVCPDGPYGLLGFSLGGGLAFEIALQLQQAGDEVNMLVIVSTPPPCIIAEGSITSRMIKKEIYTFRKLNLDLKLKYVTSRMPRLLKSLIKKSPAKSPETLLNTNVNKNLFLIWDSYQTHAKYKGNVLFINEDFKNSKYSRYHRIGVYENFVNPDALWQQYIDGPIEFENVDCDHEDFFEKPHVATVAGKIAKYLNKTLYQSQALA